MTPSHRWALIALTVTPLVAAHAEPSDTTQSFNPRLLRRFQPLRATFLTEPAADKVALGKMLYFETRLSKAGNVSCQSCHAVEKYGVDGEAFSKGTHGQRGGRNAPSTINAAGHFVQFWDGRAATIEEQALGPMLNPVEMGMADGAAVLRTLQAIPGYVEAFGRAFPGKSPAITLEHVAAAIGAYERTLVSPSRWDKFLRGDKSALTGAEVEGLRIFTNVGCMVCHTGEMLGGSTFQRVGVVEPWPNQKDRGRREVTKNPSDDMMFKVPSLRNIAKTAPYFHDGSAATLPDAITMMGRHQLGLELSDEEVTSIAAWMQSLTGELPKDAITPPKLPKGPK
jgi:cytochrome c peroxidase